MLNSKSGNIQTRHMQWKTHIELSIKRSGKEGSHGSISDLPEIKAGAAGAWAGAGEVPVRAGAEIHPEAALFHGAEAGTGRRRREASESAAIIHSKRADQPQQPVCSFTAMVMSV